MIIAIVMNDSQRVAQCYEADAPNQSKYAGPWGWSEMSTHIPVSDSVHIERFFSTICVDNLECIDGKIVNKEIK